MLSGCYGCPPNHEHKSLAVALLTRTERNQLLREYKPQEPTHLGSGHTPLGGAVHEGGDREAT